jgi:hypothetical protein
MDFGRTFAADRTRGASQAARQFEMEATVSAPADPERTTVRPSVD